MVGIDIEQVERFKNLDKHLISRVYTKNEIEYCESRQNVHIHFAGIWCCKEAVVKALSDLKLTVTEVEVLHNDLGKPYINITNKLRAYLDNINVKNIHISISHTYQTATAIAMLER